MSPIRNLTLYSDEMLLAHLKTIRELELEAMDTTIPYFASEWAGVPRQETISDLADELDKLIDECRRRGLVYQHILWPDREEVEKG